MGVNKVIVFGKKIVPKALFKFLQPAYHFMLAHVAAFWYRYPTRKMVVVGVTGTKGKTSAANFIWSCLTAGGYKTGLISTANIKIGAVEHINSYHMTMPGRFELQKILADMLKAGCTFCIVETTSEGIKQFRHLGIIYDAAVFTNLSPEHLSSHGGSIDKYRDAKGKMFAAVMRHKQKEIAGNKMPRTIVVNYDSPYRDYFLGFGADRKITYGLADGADLRAIKLDDGRGFEAGGMEYRLNVLGEFQIYNALAALATASLYGVTAEHAKKGIENVSIIHGRMEEIYEGQNFRVFVDYAHEQESLKAAVSAARRIAGNKKKVIVLIGAEGGGRDVRKRPLMGEIAGKLADFIVVSNVDPYDDDPGAIINDIAHAVEKEGKRPARELFSIEDREEGIRKALSLASSGDVVLITGKGSEQSMIISGKEIAWDDRQITRKILKNMHG